MQGEATLHKSPFQLLVETKNKKRNTMGWKDFSMTAIV